MTAFIDDFPALPIDGWQSLSSFMAQGGPVLWLLAAVAALCWLLVVERLLYMVGVYPAFRAGLAQRWQSRADKSSWYAKAIREGWLFDARRQLNRNLRVIRGLVAVCPMIGLLGTVTGMISVFDLMAANGAGDARAMANGISMATLPTLAGMVIALAGLFAHARLQKLAERQELSLSRTLRLVS